MSMAMNKVKHYKILKIKSLIDGLTSFVIQRTFDIITLFNKDILYLAKIINVDLKSILNK